MHILQRKLLFSSHSMVSLSQKPSLNRNTVLSTKQAFLSNCVMLLKLHVCVCLSTGESHGEITGPVNLNRSMAKAECWGCAKKSSIKY